MTQTTNHLIRSLVERYPNIEGDILDIVSMAKVEENIYWINRAHFIAARKHEDRIWNLMKSDKLES